MQEENAIAVEIYSQEIQKTIDSRPNSLNDLLSEDTLQCLMFLDELSCERMIVNLRKYAGSKKLSLKSFDNIIKAAKRKKNQAEKKAEKAKPRICPQVPQAKPIDIDGIPLKGLMEPGDWVIDKDGRIIKITMGENIMACPHPVIITDRLKNIDNSEEKLALAFYRDKHWSSINVNRSTVASRTSIVSIADAGIQVNSENSKDLVTYLYELETDNVNVIPCRKSIGRLGWIDKHDFFPYCKDYTFDGDDEYKDIVNAMEPIGSYEKWKTEVNKYRNSNPLVRTFLDVSFSAPLLKILNKLCYCVHLWGHTGTAKTVATYVAMSVWGNPEQLTKSFSGTAVGMEKTAAFYNSIPLALDERETAKAGSNFDEIIYKLTEGQSKLRGTRGGGLQRMSHWKLPILTNGEAPLIADNSKSGARNRTIELNCTSPLFKDPRLAASVAKENYGYAGRKWISFIQGEKPSALKALFEALYSKLSEDKNYEEKQIASLSMIVLADYLSSISIFGLNNTKAEKEALELGKTVLSQMITREETDQTNNAWDFIVSWITTNKYHFEDGTLEPWGVIEKNDIHSDVYIFGNMFNEALKSAGFTSPRGIAQGLRDKGLLIPPERGNKLQMQKWLCGKNVRCYHFIV